VPAATRAAITALDDDELAAVTALLVMFDFEENLARLSTLLGRAELTELQLTPIGDALLLDLANELAAVLTPGWNGEFSGFELEAQLPRLEALARAKLTAAAIATDKATDAARRAALVAAADQQHKDLVVTEANDLDARAG
jgi:hypothetical protein